MLRKWNSRLLVISAIVALSACASQQQAAAPINDATSQLNNAYNNAYNQAAGAVTGAISEATNAATTATNNAINTATTNATNVYGAPAYNPNATVPTYTPPTTSNRYGRVGDQYIPNYSAVDTNATTHIVSAGDTIYNIAKRYGISQETLRSLNGLSGNTISVGQALRVKSGSGSTVGNTTPSTMPTNNATNVFVTPTTPATTPSTASTSSSSTSSTTSGISISDSFLPTQNVANITWYTPTRGKVITKFGGSNKGIDIAGTRGQDVYAAADGQVVYSGSNLRGYGNLIIIQHTPSYLSAYGHNDSLIVREGDAVKGGQIIAKMGQTDSSNGVKLHFEIRENGTPVDPSRFVKF